MTVTLKIKVFLSHNSADKPAVEALALQLRKERDIEPWLDKWNLIPGQPWQEELEVAIRACDRCAIFIGRGDPQKGVLGPWQNAELRALISRQISERGSQFAVIPVLLPDAERGQRSALPTFLVANTWVEFRHSLDDPDAWTRLLAGIRRQKPDSPTDGQPTLGDCPYRGLEFFDVPHADRFFGREAVTQWLVDDLRKPLRPGSDLPRFLALLGASGSGKSSLARAGLYAELKRGVIEGSRDWLFVPPVRPGANPVESLELAMLQAAAGSPQLEAVRHELRELKTNPAALHRAARLLVPDTSPPRRLFLLVDQFEEVFTTCENEELRRAFIAALLHAARERGGPVVVALTMRADFSTKVASYEELARVFDQHQFLVGPMSEAELRLAIEEPALRAGAEFAPGLVDTLVKDVHRQPGALALLQHALLELWNRKEDGRRLTHKAYEDIGKLEGALERRANEVFRQFSAEDQELCRRAFLRLVHPGEGAEDTRRRVELRELLALGDGARVQKLIATLAAPDARLVVTEGGEAPQQAGFVEVAHETLIRSWSQLRKWLDADRAGLRTQRRLTEAAREWEEGGRKPDFLYSGARLAVAKEWVARTTDKPNALEIEFLEASVRAQQDAQADALQKERERSETLERLAATDRDRASTAERLAREAEALAKERERSAGLDREKAAVAEQLKQEAEDRAQDREHAAARATKQVKIAAALGLIAVVLAVAAGLFYQQASRDRETAEAREAEAKREKARALDLIRFMDAQVGQAFVDAVPVQLRERVSARVDAFYTEQGALATIEEHERLGYHLRKAQVHFAAVQRYQDDASFPQAAKDLYIEWERTSARAALQEALRLGEILAGRPENKDNRAIARDRILAHFHLSELATQLDDDAGARQQLQAARALLDALVQAGPFSQAELADWMDLPNLDAAEGDRAAEARDKSGAHACYGKAVALQTQLVSRRPWEETRKTELERLQQCFKETAP